MIFSPLVLPGVSIRLSKLPQLCMTRPINNRDFLTSIHSASRSSNVGDREVQPRLALKHLQVTRAVQCQPEVSFKASLERQKYKSWPWANP